MSEIKKKSKMVAPFHQPILKIAKKKYRKIFKEWEL